MSVQKDEADTTARAAASASTPVGVTNEQQASPQHAGTASVSHVHERMERSANE